MHGQFVEIGIEEGNDTFWVRGGAIKAHAGQCLVIKRYCRRDDETAGIWHEIGSEETGRTKGMSLK